MQSHPFACRVVYLILFTITGVLGAAMVWPGAPIAWLGGTWVLLLAGLALVTAAVLAWLGRHRCSLGLVGAVFAGAGLAAGGDRRQGLDARMGSTFSPRNGIVALMFALTVIAFAFRTTPHGSRARR